MVFYSRSICICLALLFFMAKGVALAQKGDDDMVNLRSDVAMLIDDAYSKGMIPAGTKDSINLMVMDTSKIRTDRDYEKMVTLRNYLMRSIVNPDYNKSINKSMQPKSLDVPMSGVSGSMSKGMDGFYKNDRGMKYVGAGWPDEEGAMLAAQRAVAAISANLAETPVTGTPKFIRDMTESNNFFLRMLGGLLNSFDNGARR